MERELESGMFPGDLNVSECELNADVTHGEATTLEDKRKWTKGSGGIKLLNSD